MQLEGSGGPFWLQVGRSRDSFGSKLGGSWLIFGVLWRLWGPKNRSKMALGGVLGPSCLQEPTRSRKARSLDPLAPPSWRSKSSKNRSKMDPRSIQFLSCFWHRFLIDFCIDFGSILGSIFGLLLAVWCWDVVFSQEAIFEGRLRRNASFSLYVGTKNQ